MATIIDISAKITNELPVLKVSDELSFSINNRKSVVLSIQCMVNENEKKAKQGKEIDDMAFMNKALEMLIGKKNTEAIEEMDLPLPEYKEVFQTIMRCATGDYSNDTPSA